MILKISKSSKKSETERKKVSKSAIRQTIFIPRLLAVSPSFCDLLFQGFPVLIRLNKQTGQLAAFTSAFANFGTLRST